MSDEAEPGSEPWYARGLRFHCTACGACCTGAPGHVWVDEADVARMAKARGMTPRQFRRRWVRRVGRRWSLRERANGDCVMLEGERCSVYAAKPQRCSTFPFWPETLESPADWAETAERCEGIGRGPRYSKVEVERVRDGDAALLLEKQALGEHVTDDSGDADRAASGDLDADAGSDGAPQWDAAFAALEALYEDLARELPAFGFTCAASGRCCDFDAYGHRLYVTTLEAAYFFEHAPAERQNPNPGHCPAWGPDRLCRARRGRMLGCRTYFCGPYPNGRPEDLHERYHRRLEALHEAYGIPFAYRDIVAWDAERRERE